MKFRETNSNSSSEAWPAPWNKSTRTKSFVIPLFETTKCLQVHGLLMTGWRIQCYVQCPCLFSYKYKVVHNAQLISTTQPYLSLIWPIWIPTRISYNLRQAVWAPVLNSILQFSRMRAVKIARNIDVRDCNRPILCSHLALVYWYSNYSW